MKDNKRIVAIALLTEFDLERLGEGFSRAWPADSSPCFGELLTQIDAADREMWQARDREQLIVTQRTEPQRRG
ncbi:hypothetical protein ABS767_05780 [Sphingomonas sp. ST-64]|uniref:Uncharacterized protein n=1 Tax=Sphingomonas plantiphila TaxID=3163295 RepID=A0ABW8YMY5_9SPHN